MVTWHDVATIQRAAAGVSGYTGRASTTTDTYEATGTVPCSIQARGSREDLATGEQVIGGWFGYFPPDVDLRSDDRIVWHGRTLTVDGEVAPWYVRGVLHHYEAPLKSL